MTATRKTKAHQIYKKSDGTRVPGVTTITGLRAKPQLINWANRMGLEGIDTNKYVNQEADVGTCCHYLVECHLKNDEPDLSDFSPNDVERARNGFEEYLKWEESVGGITLIGSEMQLVSEDLGYGGTCDIYGILGIGGKALIDLKTGESGIYPEMRMQVSAYRRLLLENGNDVDVSFIVRTGKGDGPYQAEEIKEIDTYFRAFLALKDLYYAEKAFPKGR